MQSRPHRITSDLETLAGLFYDSLEELGDFAEVSAAAMPAGYRQLLAHDEHMTVAVERFHASPVDVRVLDKVVTPTHYARKILLARQSDAQVVQFGIMRVAIAYLPPVVRHEIELERTPLGRILIGHNVLTRVHLVSLWRVAAGADLRRLFGSQGPAATYGRTAWIACNHAPAVELVEIVAPLLE